MKSRFTLGHWSRYRGLSVPKWGRSGVFLILGLALTMALVACAGSAGVSGSQGAAGAAGQAGADGSAGERGETGPAGSQGPAGAAGAAGQIGPTGPEGAPGTPGDQGQSGQSIANVIWMGDPGFRESGDRRNRNFLPNTVQIRAGETLRIAVAGFHQPAVYKVADGTTRQQVTADPSAYVNTDVLGPVDDGDIGDTNNRIALGPSPRTVDRAVVNRDRALGMDLTINEPGRYLVICAIRSHFLEQDPAANGGMFGFIDVEEQVEGQGAADITGPIGYPADVTVRFGDPRFQERGDSRNRTMLPSEVEVSAGDTIRFVTTGFHQVGIYKVDPEATRQDVTGDPDQYVDTSINGPFNDGDIGDPNNRVALGPSPRTVDREVLNRNDAMRWDLTINEPGRYLVICAIRSHFLDADPGANGGLFGFINVR